MPSLQGMASLSLFYSVQNKLLNLQEKKAAYGGKLGCLPVGGIVNYYC
jgi:hypothetical protein